MRRQLLTPFALLAIVLAPHAAVALVRGDSHEFILNRMTEENQVGPMLTGRNRDQFLVSWTTARFDKPWKPTVFIRTLACGDTSGPAEVAIAVGSRTSPTRWAEEWDGKLAARPDGSFLLAWLEYSISGDPDYTNDWTVLTRGFANPASPLGPQFAPTDGNRRFEYYQAVTPIPDGTFGISWIEDTKEFGDIDEETKVRAQRVTLRGRKRGAPVDITPFSSSGLPIAPAIASQSNGDLIIAWEEFAKDGSGDGIVMRRLRAGGLPGAETIVNEVTQGEQTDPEILAGPVDRLMVAWSSFGEDGDGGGVYGRILNADGTPLTHEFQINQETRSHQVTPRLAALPDGEFIVVDGTISDVKTGLIVPYRDYVGWIVTIFLNQLNGYWRPLWLRWPS